MTALSWILALATGCSTHAQTSSPERAKDATSTWSVKDTPDAGVVVSIDAHEGPSEEEIEEALARLSSEHGSQDIRNNEWWLKNSRYVRPRLRAMLEDDREDLMSDDWAIRILGDIGDPDDVPLLTKVLQTSKTEHFYWAARTALGKNPSPAASAALIAVTKLEDDIDRAAAAADGLGLRKNDESARARLEELINHPKSRMRFHAVNALGEMGGSHDALEKRKKIEKDAEVRQAIAKALKKK